jgi:hypothetical protein
MTDADRRREQSRLRMRAKRAADPEKYREMVRQWRKTSKGKKVIAAWRAKHRDYLEQMRRVYRGLPAPSRPKPAACECCGAVPGKRGLHLDHCHKTGKFRGWLCQRCKSRRRSPRRRPCGRAARCRVLAESWIVAFPFLFGHNPTYLVIQFSFFHTSKT